MRLGESETYATHDEVLELLAAALRAAYRLPVGGAQDLSGLAGAGERMAGAIRSTPLVDPGVAVGTDGFRDVHGLPPLTCAAKEERLNLESEAAEEHRRSVENHRRLLADERAEQEARRPPPTA